MKFAKEFPLDDMVKETGLNFVDDDYEDNIFRYKGQNATEVANLLFTKLDEILEHIVELKDQKIERNEPDLNFRAAFALQDWRPRHPVQKAVEYYEFDFEFGVEPEDTGVKNNAGTFSNHGPNDKFIADKRGYAQIIKNLADKIPLVAGQNIHFNQVVNQIHYNETGDYPIKVVAKDAKSA